MLRKLRISDIPQIHTLINVCANKGEMLPRALGELYDNARDYFVDEEEGCIVGTCALHICWEGLAEIRSLCVDESWRHRGTGEALVRACIEEAVTFAIGRLFVLTYKDTFFGKFGFAVVDKKELPQKIWTDCIKCAKFPLCDEIAMTMLVR